MADVKKPAAKKPAEAAPHMFALETKILSVVAFIALIYFAFIKGVLNSFGYTPDRVSSSVSDFANQGLDGFNWIFNIIVFVSVFVALILILGIIYFKSRHKEIVTLYKMSLPKGHLASTSTSSNDSAGASGVVVVANGETKEKPILNPSGENKRWEDVLRHMQSMNASEWKMAILEADIMLYEMLDKMGYEGETVADKLKVIEQSDFNTLDLAWRAHKVRNIIAHEGASYELSHQQAQNTIDLYKKVFEEFYFV